MIICIGREFGSGGHEIAQGLADHYGLPMYDHDLLKEIAAKKNLKSEDLEAYDELKWNRFLYRTVRGLNSSPEQNVANLQFDFLKEKDKRRKQYHNRYCPIAWGDSRNYDLVVNSSRVGVDGCVEQVKHYIDLVRKYHK